MWHGAGAALAATSNFKSSSGGEDDTVFVLAFELYLYLQKKQPHVA